MEMYSRLSLSYRGESAGRECPWVVMKLTDAFNIRRLWLLLLQQCHQREKCGGVKPWKGWV